LPIVAVAAFALFYKLGAGSLAAWDEAIYAQVAKEIAEGGDWLTLHWSYQTWFEKPPLLMWATALLFRLFGVSEFWARAASAFSGVALVAVVYFTAKLTNGKQSGVLAATILLTSYHFLSFGRFGTMDVMLALFTTLAVYAYLRLRKDGKQKHWLWIWLWCGLALMSKGAGGLIAPAVVLSALIFDGGYRDAFRSRHFWQGVLLATLIVAPWHALMYAWHGRSFTDEYVGYHVFARMTTTLEGHASGYLYYVGKLVDGFFPWCLIAPFAVVSHIRRRLRDKSGSWILLLLCALVFGFYTLIPTRRPWYIVPLYPALAVIIAVFIVNLYQTYRTRPVLRRIVAAACVVLILIGGAYSVVSLRLNHKPDDALAKLSRLARRTNADDRDALLLFSEAEPFYAQTPLFYSDRPAQNTYASIEPTSEDAARYVNYRKLADATGDASKRIILRREDMAPLSADYDIHVLAEADALAYATIKRRR
jgi:4-amino-4-deoxy-L-arabinose transferase-like glycosyltransferase